MEPEYDYPTARRPGIEPEYDYPTARRPGIVDEYCEMVDQLDSAISDLANRLQPVLQLKEPHPAANVGPDKPQAASRAREVLYRLDEQHTRVRHLIDLLEV